MNNQSKSGFRVVPDTNVIVASELAQKKQSPTREFVERWLDKEFLILYSKDTLLEYIRKLRDKNIPREKIVRLISDLSVLGILIEIKVFHLEQYPSDQEDVQFLLCVFNGEGTHIVTYDRHLLDLQDNYEFKIVELIPFLHELRVQIYQN